MRRPAEGARSRGPALSGTEFAGIGLQFALTLVLFAFLGLWLDDRLHSSPWLLLICVFVGGAASFYSMYRRVTAAEKRDAAGRAARRGANGERNGDQGGPGSGSAP